MQWSGVVGAGVSEVGAVALDDGGVGVYIADRNQNAPERDCEGALW